MSLALAPQFTLTADDARIAELLDANPATRRLVIAGALPDTFLRALLSAARRRHRELAVVAMDSTKVFLADHGPAWYRRQGIDILVVRTIALAAITINPVAPQSHRFDSTRLCALLRDAIPDVPLFDVLDPAAYAGVVPTTC